MKIINKIFLIIFISFSINITLISQNLGECGTRPMPIPNFNQNEYKAFERAFLDKLQSGAAFEVIRVPIKAHIVRPSSGVGGYTEAELATELTRVNAFYLNANIEFYMCGSVNYINDDDLYNYGASSAEETALGTYGVANIANIYFTNMTAYCGYAYFPGGPDMIVMSNSCSTNGSTLAHEIGHYFGLYHTHETSFGLEYVNGSNCSTAGDKICDTPADPTLGSSNVDNTTNCQYTGTGLDPNGQAYMPDPRNVMSYSLKTCRTRFSVQQYARIAYVQQNQRAYLTCSTAPTCGTPTAPSVSNVTTVAAVVSWSAVSGAVTYRVEYKTAAANTWTVLSNTAVTTISLSGLSVSSTYNVRVYAICSNATSAASPITSFTTNSTVACTDSNEPNNTFGQAKVISVNSITRGSISVSTDIDYYTFTTTAAAPNINIELGDLANNFDLYLYNASQTTLASSIRTGNKREAIFYNTTTAGTYYIRIIGNSGATHTNCYRLTVLTDSTSQGCSLADAYDK